MNISGQWIKVPGGLLQISVGSREYIWGVNSGYNIYQAVGGNNYWSQVPGGLSWVSAGSDGTVWGVNSSGNIYRRDVDKWTQIPGGLIQISVGDAKNVWGVNGAGNIYQWTGSNWQQIPGGLSNVSVASDGTVWGVNSSGNIYRRDADKWTQIPGGLTQISVGSANNIWGVNSSENIYRWTGSNWQQIPGSGGLSIVSAAADGSVWGVNSTGNIYYFLAEEPLLISDPKLVETKLEPNEDAKYEFSVTNTTAGVKLTNIKLVLEYDQTFFNSNGVTIPNSSISVEDLNPGETAQASFQIVTKNAEVGPYGIYGVNGAYQMEVSDPTPTANVKSTGGWMSFEVEPD